jgi:ABC-type arginine/histidine transport system permease subunit
LFKEGFPSGTRILAVNGRAYSADELKGAIRAAKGGKTPIKLLLKRGDIYRTIDLPYIRACVTPCWRRPAPARPI